MGSSDTRSNIGKPHHDSNMVGGSSAVGKGAVGKGAVGKGAVGKGTVGKTPPQNGTPQAGPQRRGKFSLSRLSAAFTRMTGGSKPANAPADRQDCENIPGQVADRSRIESDTTPESHHHVTPRMIIEGMLFVGIGNGPESDRPEPGSAISGSSNQNRAKSAWEGTPATDALTAQEMASHIRDVTPEEVEAIVGELNAIYRSEGTPYEIDRDTHGYRMQLRKNFAQMRSQFLGPVRAAKLAPAAMEVLSIVAYRQPVTSDQIRQIRGVSCSALLNQLVRRELLNLQRPADSPRKPIYRTTERFNRLFRLKSLQDLPRSEDLDDS